VSESTPSVRNGALHGALAAFTTDAASALEAEKAAGADVPFQLVESRPAARGQPPLYCYRPLTAAFIAERLGKLTALPSYAAAARALEPLEGVAEYLRRRGERRIAQDQRERADAALHCLLERVFDERTEFGFVEASFDAAYAELELALYAERALTTVIVPVFGVALHPDMGEVELDEGLSLVRGDRLEDAPAEAVWSANTNLDQPPAEPNVLAVLTLVQDRDARSPLAVARVRFGRILTALRLFERGSYALGPAAWIRADGGAWQIAALGSSGATHRLTMVAREQGDELRAFVELLSRRPADGEIAWALSRFQMACERTWPAQALTDCLLALRALLEPEGPASGRLSGRLAALCAPPEGRAALAERTARAVSLERAVIAGLAESEQDADPLVEGLTEHLRALLRDVLCGHLDSALSNLADELLAESAQESPQQVAPALG
jgi:hypothetical protein